MGNVSVELFHIYYPKRSRELYTEMQTCLAREQEYASTIPSSYIRVCMIDDQLTRKQNRGHFIPAFRYLALLDIDFIVFETDLNVYLPNWLHTQKNGNALGTEIKKTHNGTPQCSHYIALWYLLRLGIIKDEKNIIEPFSDRACKGDISFVTDTLISYLPEIYRVQEDRADNEILLKNTKIDMSKIQRIYYKV